MFKKGSSGNPYGRRVMPRGELGDAFIEAIKKVEKSKKINLLQHFIERALRDDTVLINLMRKLLPDLKSLDALIGVVEDRLDSDEAAKVREALRRGMMVIRGENTETKPTKTVKKEK